DRLFVWFGGDLALWRNHEIAEDRPRRRRLESCRPGVEREECFATRRRLVSDPEIGKPDPVDLDGNVLGENRSAVVAAFGGDASKGRKHAISPAWLQPLRTPRSLVPRVDLLDRLAGGFPFDVAPLAQIVEIASGRERIGAVHRNGLAGEPVGAAG